MHLRLCLISALALVACSPKTDLTESASDTSSSGSGTSSDNTGASVGHSQTSATPPTTSDGQTVTTASPSEPGTISATTAISETETDGSASDTFPGTVSTVTTGSMSTTDAVTTDGLCNDAPKQPQNSSCTDASGCGCASGRCFVIPALGGFCSECLEDTDCPGGGCTVPNPIAGVGAKCNTGLAGDGCQTDGACNDPGAPQCATVLEVPGIITVATCGQCISDGDCPQQAPHCTPDYDFNAFSGVHVCKAAGAVPNNNGCDFDGSGDQACASGFCGQASVMGLLKLGICGECSTDDDCGPGQQCTDPQVDIDQGVLIGSVCL